MQVLSAVEVNEVSGADAPFGCSNSMTSSQYSSAAGVWGGIGLAASPFIGTGLGAGVTFGAGVMYAYNSYCAW